MRKYEFGTRREGASAGQVALLMLLSAAIAAVVVLGILAAGTTRYRIIDTGKEQDSALISELLRDIDKYYYFGEDAPSSKELTIAAAHSLVNAVGDPYAAYYSEEEYESFRSTLNGNYKGIGVVITFDEQRGTHVERVYEDSPAEKAGILDGDYIVAVNGESVIGADLNTVSGMIGGEDGSTVTLTIMRGEEQLEIAAVRGDVYVRRVYFSQFDDGIGYIRIDSFTGSAASEFDSALDTLLAGSMTKLIIDVRNDPGGTLDTVTHIADRILPECTITTLEGKMVEKPEVYTSSAENSLDMPLVVLVNGDSASASEIFASAVQDNKAGTLMGTTTFGKGIVQTSWQVLPGQGYLKLTTDAYRTPNGELIHGVGVTPDIVVEQDPELSGVDIYYILRDYPERDLQLAAAIGFLSAN